MRGSNHTPSYAVIVETLERTNLPTSFLMRIWRWTWTQTDGFGYRQARQGLSRRYATWPSWACKQPANGEQVAAVQAQKQGKRRFTRGHLKWRMPMSSGLEAKMTQISWNRKIFLFFFLIFFSCSAQETCILCKLDWKDRANFIWPMLLLTGQGNSIAVCMYQNLMKDWGFCDWLLDGQQLLWKHVKSWRALFLPTNSYLLTVSL